MTHSPTDSFANSTPNTFMVDSGASDHISNDPSIFSNIDYSVKKNFNVVHGENITASGKGSVTLIANNARGGKTKLTLQGVYYIPQTNRCHSSLWTGPDFGIRLPGLQDPHMEA